jgi:putative membrane-bound dehydrogenase-like protein
MRHPFNARSLAGLLIVLALARGHAPASAEQQRPADREYMLEATITGYRGVGGDIDGITNPVLFALTGQTVRITIVNTDLVLHDIALEALKIRSAQILERGASASLTFTAKTSDTYYCTIPGHRVAGMEGRIEVADAPRPRPEGIAPNADGAPLDLGFESGTLDNWIATGDPFTVIEAGNVPNLSSSVRTGHVGAYWVTSQIGGSARKGTLTSKPFRVRHPYASFLVSGGAFASTRVELVLVSKSGDFVPRGGEDKVIYSITGPNRALLRPAVVELGPYLGQDIAVRLVDEESGAPTAVYLKESPWAHINFDNFRFHDSRPYFPDEVKPAEINTLPPVDHILHGGLSGLEAAAAMTVPKGFKVTLAASEPAVMRPIAFTIDDRGRLWVAEAHTYPERADGDKGKDRILIFEDTDGNGTLDRRKVFIENLNLVSGLEVGFGGVWVGAPPYLMFIPIADARTDRAGEPRILLDGFGYDDTHETLNTFTWGPDGWLYGTHGVFTHSVVGKPGAPDTERERLNGGVWRYHPTRHEFEVFAHGTSNPWGIDFNDYGHAFITACVIEHLYHVIQGAKYKRQSGSHFNRYTYDDIKTVADHVHWVGRQGPHAGNNRSTAAGGGHAHAGAMIYLGGSAGWPGESRDTIFMNNIHGARTNTDLLSRKGSGYTAAHGADFLLTNDSWSQMLNLRYGPDGSVWAIDWYDKNQCHSDNAEIHQKTLGRIFKISSAADRPVKVDLASLPSERLVEMQLDRNDWYVRHARRLLQERGPNAAVHAQLKRVLQTNGDVTRKLRAMWALHATQGFSESDLLQLMRDAESEYVRSWAIQLLLDVKRDLQADAPRVVSDAAIRQFEQMAQNDSSPLVRLYLASGLQRVPPAKRWGVIERLLAHDEDASDQNLPLLVWYAAEASVELDMPRALTLTAASKLPQVFAFAVQRVAAVGTTEALRALTDLLGRTDDVVQRRELGAGIVTIVGKKQ